MKHTVIIIGAGASKEVKLPTGHELKNIISALLSCKKIDSFNHQMSDQTIYESCVCYMNEKFVNLDINPYIRSADIISRSLPLAISIDNYLDAHKGNEIIELCGKLAIVKAILDCERRSSLYTSKDDNLNFKTLENTWFNKFFMLLTENCQVNDLQKRLESVSFIIFNYDRCLEHFLFNSLILYYNIPMPLAGELVNSINIYHPYGIVGRLPWQNNSIEDVEFGSSIGPKKLLRLSKQIKTFTEGTNPNSDERMKLLAKLKSCNRLIFLGFGFHKLNMDLISPKLKPGEIINASNIFATAKGISSSDLDSVHESIRRISGVKPTRNPKIIIDKEKLCSDFFDEYWRQLSFT